ncbi:MAG: hypothetical protein P4L28_07265 [Paludibacteraceae bacterium]|nr:hypothetical protein [Paludibacteraceae bacterium]
MDLHKITSITEIQKVLCLVDLSFVFILLLILSMSIWVCFFRSLVSRFKYLFYAIGFILFVGTYFLINKIDAIPNDGTIAIVAFVIIVLIVLIKNIHENSLRKDYP